MSPPTARPAASVRRQARGERRIESILDAAEQLVADVGYEEAGTNAIAARAGISPGSLYQFFGNKDEILDALVERYRGHLRAFWEAQLGPGAVELPLGELVDRVVDALVAFKAARPAFWALFHGSATSGRLAGAARELDGEVARRLEQLFRARAPHLTPERCGVVASVSVATVKSVMAIVFEPTGTGQVDAAAELKGVLIGYLGPALAG